MPHQQIFLAGFQKCGTTTLHEVLLQHPGIRGGRKELWPDQDWRSKEPHFFDWEYHRGLAWYENHFEPGGSYRLDSSPDTLTNQAGIGLGRIREHFPKARFVILMRDPIQRAFSAWNHWRELPPKARWKNVEGNARSFAKTIQHQLSIDSPDDGARTFVSVGYYARHLRRLFALFPREQVLILWTTDLENAFDTTMARVEAHLGLSPHPWQALHSHVRNPSGWLPDRATAALLAELYRPHNEALEELLGERPPWMATPNKPPRGTSPALITELAPAPPAKKRVCVVLPRLSSAVDNENHARAVASMARDLRSAGHYVRILAGHLGKPVPQGLLDQHLAGEDLLHVPPWLKPMASGAPPWTIQSVAIMRELEKEPWDTLVLPAAEGIGHATLQLLQQGHHPHPCRASVYLAGRGPLTFHRRLTGVFLQHPREAQRDWLERRCLELADDVLLPSMQALADCLDESWKLPETILTGEPGIPSTRCSAHMSPGLPWLHLAEGDDLGAQRLLAWMDDGWAPSRFFAGASLPGSSGHCDLWRRKLAPLACTVELPPAGAKVVLLSPPCLNSWPLLDLLRRQCIPLATELSKVAELVWETERPKVPRVWHPGRWRKAVEKLSQTNGPAEIHWAENSAYPAWLASFESTTAPARVKAMGPGPEAPLISVCMPTWNRTSELRETIHAFAAQTWPNLEVVVANDGSTDPNALALHAELKPMFAERGWLWLDIKNGGPSKARNHAAASARGDILLFADDDNIPLPHHVTTLATTLLVGNNDIALAHMAKFSTPLPPESFEDSLFWWMPTGGESSLGLLTNTFGETSMMMFRRTFRELGGFPTDTETGRPVEEDRLILTRAFLRGLSLAHFPKPTYWYRVGDDARHHQFVINSWGCQSATIDVHATEGPSGLRGLFEFAHSLWDYGTHELKAPQDKKSSRQLAQMEREYERLSTAATEVAGATRKLVASRRWKIANLPRLDQSVEKTYPPLSRALEKLQTLLDRHTRKTR